MSPTIRSAEVGRAPAGSAPAGRPGRGRVSVEHVGREDEAGRHARGIADRVELLRHGELEVEVGDHVAVIERADPQPGSSKSGRAMVRNSSITWNNGECAVDRGGSSASTTRSNGMSACMNALRSASRTRRNSSPNEQLPPTSQRRTRVLTNIPTMSSSAAAPRPAMGCRRDVVGPAEPRQQRGQRRVHHHEHARVVARGRARQAPVQPPATRTRRGRRTGSGRRPGPVARQVQHLGQARQRRGPVVQLTGERGVRVVGVAQPVALPQRVVRVLRVNGVHAVCPWRSGPRRPPRVPRERPSEKPSDENVVQRPR